MSLTPKGEGEDKRYSNMSYINSDKTIDLTADNSNHSQMEVTGSTSERSSARYELEPHRSIDTVTGDPQPEKLENIRVFNLDKDKFYSNNIYVVVESTNSNLGRLHPMYVGHIFHRKLKVPNIINIEKSGLNRVKVYVRGIKDANLLVQNENLAKENLRAFIPNHLLFRKAVIRNVDTYFDDDYLTKNIESPYNILEVKRLKRKVMSDGNASYVDTQSVVISFEGNILPKSVIINSVILEVEPFIQRVIQCFKCLRYGHVARQCRSKNNLCNDCGKSIEENHTCVAEDIFCLHCNNNSHSTTSKNCPVFNNQKKIKAYMASSNVTFIEAKKIIESSFANSVSTSNRFEILSNLSDINFPKLSETVAPPRRPFLSQPIQNKPNQSQCLDQQPNKKRKTITSPIPTTHPQSMFPFVFGPSQPLPQNTQTPNLKINKDKIVLSFYNLIQHIVNRASSVEEIKSINDKDLKNEISILIDKVNRNG